LNLLSLEYLIQLSLSQLTPDNVLTIRQILYIQAIHVVEGAKNIGKRSQYSIHKKHIENNHDQSALIPICLVRPMKNVDWKCDIQKHGNTEYVDYPYLPRCLWWVILWCWFMGDPEGQTAISSSNK